MESSNPIDDGIPWYQYVHFYATIPLLATVVLYAAPHSWHRSNRAFLYAAGLTATPIPVHGAYVASVDLFYSRGGCKGYFSIHTNELMPTAQFLLRIVGPEIAVPLVRKIRASEYAVDYSLTRAGVYYAELILQYASFDGELIKNSTFLPIYPPVFGNYSFNCSRTTSVKPFNCTSSRGRWVVDNATYIPYLRSTRHQGEYLGRYAWPTDPINRFHHAAHPELTSFDPNYNYGLHYEHDCIVHDFVHDREALRTCLHGKRICLYGDSQMRHLLWAIGAVNGADWCRYTPTAYSGFATHDATAIGSCNYVLFNFGQWPAAHTAGIPWAFSKYEAAVAKNMSFAAEMQRNHTNLQFFWIATNPHGIGMHVLAQHDWRVNPVLDKYNKIAIKLAALHNVTFIDSYSVGRPLNDLAYDFAHYKGSVGFAMANVVLNGICNKNITRGPFSRERLGW